MAAFSGDVKLPVIGNVPKVAVVVGVGGVGVLIFLKNRSSKTSSTASTPGGAPDPYPSDGTIGDPTDPNSVDPASGVTYGDEAVGYGGNANYGALAASGIGGGLAYPWDGTYNNSNDPYSMDTSTGQTFGNEGYGGSGGGSGSSGGPPFSTNAQWAQYAETYLTGTVGLDAATVSAALGLYIAGSSVTSAQAQVIQEALAYAGSPPVTGTNGMPPSINVGTTTTGQGQVTVPNVVGMRREQAQPTLQKAGLGWQYTNPPPTGDTHEWIVASQSPKNGTRVASGSPVSLTIKQGGGTTKKPPGPPVKKG